MCILCTASFGILTLQNSGNFLQKKWFFCADLPMASASSSIEVALKRSPTTPVAAVARWFNNPTKEFFRLPGQNITMFAVKGNLVPPSKSRSANSKESKDQVMGQRQCPWPNRHTHVWSYSVLNVALGENCKLMEQYPPEMAKILWSSGSEARETSCNEVAGVFLRMG